jgi:hypothetical protein
LQINLQLYLFISTREKENMFPNQSVLPSTQPTYSPPDTIIDIPQGPTNPISKGLLQLKKAASYAITATGISTKVVIVGVIVGTNSLFSLAIFSAIILSYSDEGSDLLDAEDSFFKKLMPWVALGYLALASLGAKKAGELIDSSLQQASQLTIKVAKGAVYLLTLGLLVNYGRNIADNILETQRAPEDPTFIDIMGLPLVVGLSTLGASHAVNLISHSEQKLQDRVKKIQ